MGCKITVEWPSFGIGMECKMVLYTVFLDDLMARHNIMNGHNTGGYN